MRASLSGGWRRTDWKRGESETQRIGGRGEVRGGLLSFQTDACDFLSARKLQFQFLTRRLSQRPPHLCVSLLSKILRTGRDKTGGRDWLLTRHRPPPFCRATASACRRLPPRLSDSVGRLRFLLAMPDRFSLIIRDKMDRIIIFRACGTFTQIRTPKSGHRLLQRPSTQKQIFAVMKHDHCVHQPLPGIKNQRRFAVLWMAAIFCLLLINSGCVSYHVSSDGKRPDARSYALITQQLKLNTRGYGGSGLSLIGANENGITTIEDLYITSNTLEARARTHRWDEIQDVKVRAYFVFLFGMVGLVDPTAGSEVQIKFCDGQETRFTALVKPDILNFTPLWLFSTTLGKAHQTAVAIQDAAAWHKQNAGTTTLKNP